MVENIDMKHSSRKVWDTITRLTGTKKVKPPISPVKASDIANCLSNELKTAWNTPFTD